MYLFKVAGPRWCALQVKVDQPEKERMIYRVVTFHSPRNTRRFVSVLSVVLPVRAQRQGVHLFSHSIHRLDDIGQRENDRRLLARNEFNRDFFSLPCIQKRLRLCGFPIFPVIPNQVSDDSIKVPSHVYGIKMTEQIFY